MNQMGRLRKKKTSGECFTRRWLLDEMVQSQVTLLGVRLRDLEAGHIILADRHRIVRILGLLARIDAASRATGIEGRARSTGRTAWGARFSLAGLARLAG